MGVGGGWVLDLKHGVVGGGGEGAQAEGAMRGKFGCKYDAKTGAAARMQRSHEGEAC